MKKVLYADDVVLLAESKQELEDLAQFINASF